MSGIFSKFLDLQVFGFYHMRDRVNDDAVTMLMYHVILCQIKPGPSQAAA